LAINDHIFNNTSPSPSTVVAKEKYFLLKTMEKHFSTNEITLLPK
jgi:hypothetical protein